MSPSSNASQMKRRLREIIADPPDKPVLRKILEDRLQMSRIDNTLSDDSMSSTSSISALSTAQPSKNFFYIFHQSTF